MPNPNLPIGSVTPHNPPIHPDDAGPHSRTLIGLRKELATSPDAAHRKLVEEQIALYEPLAAAEVAESRRPKMDATERLRPSPAPVLAPGAKLLTPAQAQKMASSYQRI